MNDQPGLGRIGPVQYTQVRAATPLDKLWPAHATATYWAIAIGVNAAIPCIVWLWRWAL